VGLERLGQLKNPVTSSGIEPATFRLVCLIIKTSPLHAGVEPTHESHVYYTSDNESCPTYRGYAIAQAVNFLLPTATGAGVRSQVGSYGICGG
jgi:hypothetical protein